MYYICEHILYNTFRFYVKGIFWPSKYVRKSYGLKPLPPGIISEIFTIILLTRTYHALSYFEIIITIRFSHEKIS